MTSSSKTEPTTLRRWVVVMSASLLFFYSFMQLNILNQFSSLLMHFYHINAAQLGTVSAMYFYADFILLIPAGLLLDQFSTKKLILIAMIFSTVSMFVLGEATNAFAAGFARFLSGIGGGFCFLSCIRLASRWFPAKKMAFVAGCLVTMCMLGGMTAQTPTALLYKLVGWRYSMFIIGIMGVVFIGIISLAVQDWPCGIKPERRQISLINFLQNLFRVFSNRYNWCGGLYTAFLNLPIFLFGALWGSLYLMQIHHLTHAQSSYVISMIFIGTTIGSPIIGWISDNIERRILPMIVGAIISLLIILIIIYAPNLSFDMLMVLFFLLGFITSTQSLSYPVVTALNPPEVTGSANSVVSMTLMASGFVFQPLFGWLMGLHWDHRIVNNVAIYSVQDFKLALLIMPALFIAAFIVTLFLKEPDRHVV